MAKTNTEKDALIAEHVMGWQWWRFRIKKKATVANAGTGYDEWCQLIPPNETWPRQPRWGGILCKTQIANIPDETSLGGFSPSTNPADAMAVLKKCAKKCKSYITIQHDAKSKPDVWEVAHICITAEAPTLELAICDFALKLYGVEL